MLKTIIFPEAYLITALILLIIFIVFNVLSMINHIESNKINVQKSCTNCKITEPVVDSPPKCVQIGGLFYEVSTEPTYYITVCSEICPQGIKTNGDCKSNQNFYQECINQLQPPKGCCNSAKPLCISSDDKTSYYANSILEGSKLNQIYDSCIKLNN